MDVGREKIGGQQIGGSSMESVVAGFLAPLPKLRIGGHLGSVAGDMYLLDVVLAD